MNNISKDFAGRLQAINVANCHAKALGQSNLVECLTETHACCWRKSIGRGEFCTHSLNAMIAHAALPISQLLPQVRAVANRNV